VGEKERERNLVVIFFTFANEFSLLSLFLSISLLYVNKNEEDE
jgi:hypothetical protein